jgi:MFS family permease
MRSVNRKIKILLITNNLWIFAEGMMGPLFAIFTERIGGSVLDISWSWAVYLGVTGVGVIFVGHLSDIIPRGKERLVVVGYALNALVTLCYIFVHSPAQLLLAQAGLGIALALANPTWYALYDRHAPRHATGFFWGLADGQGKIFSAIAILVGGFIVQRFSFEALFLTMGLIQLIATLYLAKLLK